jgi:hypothetical protein
VRQAHRIQIKYTTTEEAVESLETILSTLPSEARYDANWYLSVVKAGLKDAISSGRRAGLKEAAKLVVNESDSLKIMEAYQRE